MNKKTDFSQVRPASKKIVDRMKKLREMPPPTMESVIKQSKASAEIRKKMSD